MGDLTLKYKNNLLWRESHVKFYLGFWYHVFDIPILALFYMKGQIFLTKEKILTE